MKFLKQKLSGLARDWKCLRDKRKIQFCVKDGEQQQKSMEGQQKSTREICSFNENNIYFVINDGEYVITVVKISKYPKACIIYHIIILFLLLLF